MAKLKFYRCENKACTLGARGQPAFFSGGRTSFQTHVETGQPEETLEEGKDYGEGICPTCGEPAKLDSEDRTPVEGNDPYQKLHDKIGGRVADVDDPLNKDTAQEALLELVEKVGEK